MPTGISHCRFPRKHGVSALISNFIHLSCRGCSRKPASHKRTKQQCCRTSTCFLCGQRIHLLRAHRETILSTCNCPIGLAMSAPLLFLSRSCRTRLGSYRRLKSTGLPSRCCNTSFAHRIRLDDELAYAYFIALLVFLEVFLEVVAIGGIVFSTRCYFSELLLIYVQNAVVSRDFRITAQVQFCCLSWE